MNKPKAIYAKINRGGLAISVIGFRSKDSIPYLSINIGDGQYGFIEDRDIKRLRMWCDDCLKKRSKVRR